MTTKTKRTEIEALLLQDINKPSLHALSYALRHPEVWPEGFVWDFGHCDQCAGGLAHALWKSLVPDLDDADDNASEMARVFAIPYGVSKDIFMGRGDWVPTKVVAVGPWWRRVKVDESDFDAITPEMVADQIDLYLETVR